MNVEYAISLGIMEWDAMWRIEYLHPLDFGKRMITYVPMSRTDERIGTEIDNISVAKPGERLVEVLGWLFKQVSNYPYYWHKEGKYVDRYGYDFSVKLGGNGETTEIEISQIAYEILREEIGIKDPNAPSQEVDIQNDIIESGGALVKLHVILDRAQPISHVTLAPFSKFPMSIAALMYEQDIETFHPKQEIVFANDNGVTIEESERAIRIQFPSVVAKRVTIILRQKHHEQNTYNVSSAQVNKTQLWEAISQREAQVTLDPFDGQETLSTADQKALNGWALYTANSGNKKAMEAWKKEFDTYKRKQSERNRTIIESARVSESNGFRSEYEAATRRYSAGIQFEI